jgi:hypothetical protein
MSAVHSSLNFLDLKQRSMKAMKTRVKLDPVNNQAEFDANSNIQFRLPASVMNTYADFASDWTFNFTLRLGTLISPTGATGADTTLILDKAGANSLFRRLVIRQAGVQLAEVNDFSVLSCILKDLNVNQHYAGNAGNLLEGMTPNGAGISLTTQIGSSVLSFGEYSFSVPLSLTNFSSSNRMIPLFGLAPIEIELDLQPACYCGSWNYKETNGATITYPPVPITDDKLKFSDFQMVGYYCELSPQSQQMVNESNGGIYRIISQSWRTSQVSVPAGSSVVTEIIPISVSSLSRILVAHRKKSLIGVSSTTDNNLGTPFSSGSRYYPLLTQYQVFIGGKPYPERPVKGEGNLAEMMAENMIADHRLTGFNKGCSFNALSTTDTILKTSKEGRIFHIDHPSSEGIVDGTGTKCGSFVAMVELESLNIGMSDSMFGGISTIGTTVSWKGLYKDIQEETVITFCSQFETVLTLDIRGSGVFAYSQ